MPKLKTHKGLAKRIKITGKGKVKFRKTGSGHLMSHKTGDQRREMKKATVAKSGDVARLSRMLHRSVTAGDKVFPEKTPKTD